MKTSNKGFSLVELIIVIAIMAILAGALAPALIKYINKSRLSSDIQNANTLGTACQTAMASEAAYDDAVTLFPNAGTSVAFDASWYGTSANGNAFKSEVGKIVGGSKQPQTKAKKCNTSGHTYTSKSDYKVTMDIINNKVEVVCGTHTFFPVADTCMTN